VFNIAHKRIIIGISVIFNRNPGFRYWITSVDSWWCSFFETIR